MERPARFIAVLLLRHLAAAEFSENRDRFFGSVEPINTYAVVGVGVFLVFLLLWHQHSSHISPNRSFD
jgi:hypothetical protein